MSSNRYQEKGGLLMQQGLNVQAVPETGSGGKIKTIGLAAAIVVCVLVFVIGSIKQELDAQKVAFAKYKEESKATIAALQARIKTLQALQEQEQEPIEAAITPPAPPEVVEVEKPSPKQTVKPVKRDARWTFAEYDAVNQITGPKVTTKENYENYLKMFENAERKLPNGGQALNDSLRTMQENLKKAIDNSKRR